MKIVDHTETDQEKGESVHGFVQQAGGAEQGVANRFGFDAPGASMPKQFVVGIDFRAWIGVNAIALHVGLTGKDGSMKRFDAPVVFHKLAG